MKKLRFKEVKLSIKMLRPLGNEYDQGTTQVCLVQSPCTLHHAALTQQYELTDAAQIKIAWTCGKHTGMGYVKWVGQMLKLGTSMCTV